MKRITNELSDEDLMKYLKEHNIKINKICFQDQLPEKLKIGFYIINLQSSTDGNGTHWVSLYYNPNMSIYFDPFGFVPPKEIEERLNKYIYNDIEVQYINDTSCGYYSLAFIQFLYNRNNKYDFFNTFINLFNHADFKKNNSICETILNSQEF